MDPRNLKLPLLGIIFVSIFTSTSALGVLSGETDKDPLWNPDSVPKRRRSKHRPHILSPAERLQRRLHKNLREPDFENISDDEENVTLIYARNKYIAPNEIGLGVMLFVPPPTTTERSTSLSTMTR